MAISNSSRFFSKLGLWQLYTAVAFPMHVWAIILILMDLSWVAERTNSWDAIGVAAYGLMFVLIESLAALLVVALVGVLLPVQWSQPLRIALLGVLALVINLWAIFGQLYFFWELSLGDGLIRWMASTPHPLWVLYGGFLAVITPTVALPAWAAFRYEKFQRGFLAFLDRLSPLMGFYIFLDLAGIVIVIIRNLGG